MPERSKDKGSILRDRGWLLFPLSFLLAWWLWGLAGGGEAPQIAYSSFRDHLDADNLEWVRLRGDNIEGSLLQTDENQSKEFLTYLPSVGDDELLDRLRSQGVEICTESSDSGSLWPYLFAALPILLIIWLMAAMGRMRQQGQGLFSIGQNKAKLYEKRKESIGYDRVAGLEAAKTELREVIEFLKEPERFGKLGGNIPKGLLLVGPPGTGKTLLARATAGEAGVPFFSMTGSDFMEMFVGVGASRVRSLFADARKSAPSILFIDELDSIGRRRGAGLGGGHDEREQTLNQLLSEMDGFTPSENVIVLAATNRPDILDPALLRPGRFDRRVSVDLPNVKARREILEIHAQNKPLTADVDLERVAHSTPGFSGADLENLLNEAALLAGRRRRSEIELDDIEEARDKMMLGLEREGIALTKEECRLLAYHEGGHAVVAAVLPEADPLHKVTIVPRGQSMGATQQLPARDRYVYSREYVMDRIAVLMAGRAAEELVIGTPTSGAESDLKEALRLARKLVLDWGISDTLSRLALGGARQEVFLGEEIGDRRNYSDETARQVDVEVQRLLDLGYEKAMEVLRHHRTALEKVAKALMQKEEIAGSEVLDLVGEIPQQAKPAASSISSM